MTDRADYKKQDKSHWPDFKHKPKSTRENKKITNRMTRQKKKQDVSEDDCTDDYELEELRYEMMDWADDESEVSGDAD